MTSPYHRALALFLPHRLGIDTKKFLEGAFFTAPQLELIPGRNLSISQDFIYAHGLTNQIQAVILRTERALPVDGGPNDWLKK